jgi:hypothetical protein
MGIYHHTTTLYNQIIMDDTAGVSCGRIAEAEHAIEGIRGDMKIIRRGTDEIEEVQLRTNKK